MAFLRAKEEEDIQFQMAPMIDVVFLLLIFFLVATSFISEESQIQTNLPQKQEEPEEEVPQQFVVMVTKKGILVNKRPIKKALFRDKLIRLKSGGEEVYVFVDSKDDAVHQDVVEILDMVTDVGAKVTVVPPYEERD